MVNKLLLLILLFPSLALAQLSPTSVIIFNGPPTGTCPPIIFAINKINGDFYDCFVGNWYKIGPSAGGGTVTDVTASLPLSSSGGATPNISISQSGVGTNGYLSSVDWNTFNNKQIALTTHTCGAGDFINEFSAPNTFNCATPAGSGFPRLDQILDPTADKTFTMGAKTLTFTGTGGFPGIFLTFDAGGGGNTGVGVGSAVTGAAIFDFDAQWNGGINAAYGYSVNGTATLGNCLVGDGTVFKDQACPAGSLRLDQILDPTSDKTFSTTTFKTTFNGQVDSTFTIGIPASDGAFDANIQSWFSTSPHANFGRAVTGALAQSGSRFIFQGESQVGSAIEAIGATSNGSALFNGNIVNAVNVDGFYVGTNSAPSAFVVGVNSASQNFSTGTIGNLVGFRASPNLNLGGGVVTNSYGILVDDQAAGSTNYAIKTGLGQNSFGDKTTGTRFSVANATALVSGDFALSGGWGDTASIGSISGTDQSFRATVTSAGIGQADSPTLTLTFHDGTWTTVPVYSCKQVGGTGIQSDLEQAETATTLVGTWLATPVAGDTYIFNCVAMGI